jgi:hypothetical protein
MLLYCKTTSYNSSPDNINYSTSFSAIFQEVFYIVYVSMMTWKEPPVIIEKTLPPFIKVKALLFFIQCGQTNFPYELQCEIISYVEKSYIIHINIVFI